MSCRSRCSPVHTQRILPRFETRRAHQDNTAGVECGQRLPEPRPGELRNLGAGFGAGVRAVLCAVEGTELDAVFVEGEDEALEGHEALPFLR